MRKEWRIKEIVFIEHFCPPFFSHLTPNTITFVIAIRLLAEKQSANKYKINIYKPLNFYP